jgi:hypothetical protein
MTMASGKIAATLLLLVLFFPAAEACLVTSTIEMQVEQSDQIFIPPNDAVTLTANVTLSWGFGAFLPLPVNIYVEAMDLPSWVYVSPINSFTITPQNIWGGSESQSISIRLTSSDTTNAFVFRDLTLQAFTNGSFLVRGSEGTQVIRVAQAFEHRELVPHMSMSSLSLTTGETQRIFLNMTNRCNADLSVSVKPMNFSSDWSIRNDRSEVIIPSNFSGNPEVSIPLLFKADDSSEENGWVEITYYPTKDAEWGPEIVTLPLFVKSRDEGTSIGTMATVAILLLIVVVIIVLIWRKYRQPQDF